MNREMAYQEIPIFIIYILITMQAVVIHGTHDILTLYYAKFPNDYLEIIAKHGAEFKKYSYTKHVYLYRTRIFHMHSTDQPVKFFELRARLFNYLISGKSHVGYLHDHETNCLHTYVLYITIF